MRPQTSNFKLQTSKWFLYLTLFIEGGSLMAVELIGAKLSTPIFGNSLYVWTSVLAITLMALALGYFLGGKISKRFPNIRTLIIIISLSFLFVVCMPFTSDFVMNTTSSLNLKLGIVISCLIFLLPPLTCFGMVNPLIIRLLSTEINKVGRTAGRAYFTSTSGGIIFTFLFAFFFIPDLGLKASIFITATLLVIIPLIYFLYYNIKKT